MDGPENPGDKELMDKLEEFVRLKKEFDNLRSLTAVQLFTIAIAGVVLMFFLGFTSLFFGGFFGGLMFGTIFASVVSTISILGAVENMKNLNILDFVEVRNYKQEIV